MANNSHDDINNNDIFPNKSPKIFAVHNLSVERMRELTALIEEYNATVAKKVFEHIVILPDNIVLNGLIPYSNSDEELDQYIKILNPLFKLVDELKNIGIIQLSNNIVKDFDIRTATLAKVVSFGQGEELLEVLCDIANQERQARIPKSHLSAKTLKVEIFGELPEANEI